MFQTPPPPRFSPKRLAFSIVLHAAALFLALSLRFSAPVAEVTATPTFVTILAPSRPLTPVPPPQRTPLPLKPTPRAFSAPIPNQPPRLRAAQIEAALPEQAPPPPPPLEPRAATILPPPPIVIGKLTPASSAAPPAESPRTLRATTFGALAPAAEPEPPRAAKPSGFAAASVAAEPQRRTAASAPATPVEIHSKPRPLYTEEARRLKIEGEVLLEVLFSAAGTARVERVLRGLGHGLDESAAAAAAAIQFRPAQRAGQPVDQLATVHITFQLAY